jgi:prevent-host-death family protein
VDESDPADVVLAVGVKVRNRVRIGREVVVPSLRGRAIDVAEATRPLSEYVREAQEGPVVVTVDGRPVAVVMAIEDADLDMAPLSTNPKFMALIERARARQRCGRYWSLPAGKVQHCNRCNRKMRVAATYQGVPVDLARQVVRIRQERGLHVNVFVDERIYIERLRPEADLYLARRSKRQSHLEPSVIRVKRGAESKRMGDYSHAQATRCYVNDGAPASPVPGTR